MCILYVYSNVFDNRPGSVCLDRIGLNSYNKYNKHWQITGMHAKAKLKHLAISLEKQTKDYQLIQRCTRYLALVWWKPGRRDPISRGVGTEYMSCTVYCSQNSKICLNLPVRGRLAKVGDRWKKVGDSLTKVGLKSCCLTMNSQLGIITVPVPVRLFT